jgi:hypothetical protein
MGVFVLFNSVPVLEPRQETIGQRRDRLGVPAPDRSNRTSGGQVEKGGHWTCRCERRVAVREQGRSKTNNNTACPRCGASQSILRRTHVRNTPGHWSRNFRDLDIFSSPNDIQWSALHPVVKRLIESEPDHGLVKSTFGRRATKSRESLGSSSR